MILFVFCVCRVRAVWPSSWLRCTSTSWLRRACWDLQSGKIQLLQTDGHIQTLCVIWILDLDYLVLALLMCFFWFSFFLTLPAARTPSLWTDHLWIPRTRSSVCTATPLTSCCTTPGRRSCQDASVTSRAAQVITEWKFTCNLKSNTDLIN